jgi:RES domain-containing protein
MSVNPSLTTTAYSGTSYFRITSLSFRTTNVALHTKVVNGQGAVMSRTGARYNHPGVATVYLTEDLETGFAEKMFYFHREILRGIDLSHHMGVVPPFKQQFILWEIVLNRDIPDVLDMCDPRALSFFNIFPSMTLNPSQDYEHLKVKRADIQSSGYQGLRVPSSRSKTKGNLIVLFGDQSKNIQSIIPYQVEFRLVTSGGTPFVTHAQDILDFTVGEVKITSSTLPAAATGGNYQYWQRVNFNH